MAGIHSGEGLALDQLQPKRFEKKIPNAQIPAPGAADPLPSPAPFSKSYKRTRCIKITTSALWLFEEQHFKLALNLQTTQNKCRTFAYIISYAAHTQNVQYLLCKHKVERIQTWKA